MTVIILERVAPGLRGELSRWMVEVGTGVFVGRLSALVREKLWERCEAEAYRDDGSALIVWRANTAQGFAVQSANARGRYAEDVDGVWLVRVPGRARRGEGRAGEESGESGADGVAWEGLES